MTSHQMARVRVASAEALHAVRALIRGFSGVPPTVLFVMGWMTELAVAIRAREAG